MSSDCGGGGELGARELWDHIFGDERGLLQIFTGVRSNGKIGEETIQATCFNYPGAVAQAEAWALAKSDEGREVYFCSHLLAKPRRAKENAAPIRALWGEMDGAALPDSDVAPTAVVESSPGRFHTYWRLSDPIPPGAAEQLNLRLAHEIGADSSGFDLTQLLRVPGTVNHKYDERPLVRVLSLANKDYSAADLDARLPHLEKGQHRERGDAARDDAAKEPPVVLNPQALRVWQGLNPKIKDGGEIDRSASLLKIGRVLYDAGATRQTIIDALMERDAALGWRCYTDRPDAGKRYAEIFDELERNGRNPRVRIVPDAGADTDENAQPEWPRMEDSAYRGLFGEIVELVEPHTEGDPVAILLNSMAAFGNALGRGPYVQIGATRHHTNLYVGIVGATAKGRKGSAWDPVENLLQAADSYWATEKIASGLSSGEGVINEIRDRLEGVDADGSPKVIDPGVEDKRLLIMEAELAQALKAMKREGNLLSPVLRNGWDSKTLRTLVKHNPLRATDPHVSILGHITREELVKHLIEIELANGLANRFLWVLAKRSKSLPFGGEWHTVDLAPMSRKIRAALEAGKGARPLKWSAAAKPLWCEAYEMLTEDRLGMFGAVTARAEAQTLRLSILYALADGSLEIDFSHVESALAVWEYAEESARIIFGDRIGDPDADKVLDALKNAEDGLTRSQIRDLFGRNKSADDLNRIQRVLLEAQRIKVTRAPEHGSSKPVERWYAA